MTLVKLKGATSSVNWVLLELQGELCNLNLMNELSIDGKTCKVNLIGDLHFDEKSGNPLLIIGHHLLTGKREKLMKPYVAFKKLYDNNSESKCICYEVYAVAREKLIFNQRPKPIITASSVQTLN